GDLDSVKTLLDRDFIYRKTPDDDDRTSNRSRKVSSTTKTWDPRYFLCKRGSGNQELVEFLYRWMENQESSASEHDCPLGNGEQLLDEDREPEDVTVRRTRSTSKTAATLLNAKNKDGRTPLMFACKYGHLEVLRFLVQDLPTDAVDISAVSTDGSNAFDWAIFGGNMDLIRFF
ncbi:unnamed protein product, partial [Amoebophrya sp. A25]